MGGYGSGYALWRDRKTTVESCLTLSADKLTRDKMLAPGIWRGGTLTWTNTRTGKELSAAGYEVNTMPGRPPWLRLHYTVSRTKEAFDYKLGLTSSPTPWRTLRWFFVCPLSVGGRSCGRRVGKLYLPPGARYYGCRHCYDLTYTSCRESHKNDAMYRGLARDAGLSFDQVKRMMEE